MKIQQHLNPLVIITALAIFRGMKQLLVGMAKAVEAPVLELVVKKQKTEVLIQVYF
jgi:hypothetical protein